MAYNDNKITLDTLFQDQSFYFLTEFKNTLSNTNINKFDHQERINIAEELTRLVDLAIEDINCTYDYTKLTAKAKADFDKIIKSIFAMINLEINKIEVVEAITEISYLLKDKEPEIKLKLDKETKKLFKVPDKVNFVYFSPLDLDKKEFDLLFKYFKGKYNYELGIKENILNLLNCDDQKLEQIINISEHLMEITQNIETVKDSFYFDRTENYSPRANKKPYKIEKRIKRRMRKNLENLNNTYNLGLSQLIKDDLIIHAIEKDLNKILKDK